MVCDQLDAQFFYAIRLFQSSTCFDQTRAHHQEVNCINPAPGIVTLKTNEWSKITKIQFNCIVYKTLTSNHTVHSPTDAHLLKFCECQNARCNDKN
jgi:hypothetical protein